VQLWLLLWLLLAVICKKIHHSQKGAKGILPGILLQRGYIWGSGAALWGTDSDILSSYCYVCVAIGREDRTASLAVTPHSSLEGDRRAAFRAATCLRSCGRGSTASLRQGHSTPIRAKPRTAEGLHTYMQAAQAAPAMTHEQPKAGLACNTHTCKTERTGGKRSICCGAVTVGEEEEPAGEEEPVESRLWRRRLGRGGGSAAEKLKEEERPLWRRAAAVAIMQEAGEDVREEPVDSRLCRRWRG